MNDSKIKRLWLTSIDEHIIIKQEIEEGFKWIGLEDLVGRDARVFIKGSSLFRVGNLKISILNSLLTALQ